MKREDLLKRLEEVFRDVFDDSSIVISGATSSDDIKDWDSLMHITLISAVENEFAIKFSMQEIMDMKNVGEMAGLVEQKIGDGRGIL